MPATSNLRAPTIVRTTITLGEQRATLDNATDAQIVNMTNIVVKMHELAGYQVEGLKVVTELVAMGGALVNDRDTTKLAVKCPGALIHDFGARKCPEGETWSGAELVTIFENGECVDHEGDLIAALQR